MARSRIRSLCDSEKFSVVAVVDAVALGFDQHGRLLIREEQPLLVGSGEFVERSVDVDTQPHDDAAKVGALPGSRPRGDRAFANGQCRIGNQKRLGDVVHQTEAVTARARTRRGVGRESLRGEMR
jgi:hypothetical protein